MHDGDFVVVTYVVLGPCGCPNLNTTRFRGCSGVRRTLRHQPPPVSRSWSKTAVHKLGGSVRMLRPRTRPYPAVSKLVRNGCNACYILFVRCLWCDVVRGRSTEREAASHGAGSTHRVERIESTNQIGSHGRVHLSNRIFTAHTNSPVFYYFTVLMFIGFGQKK